VEADGSRRLPIKAPRAKEPVTPSTASLVIGILGLSALGQPADEKHVFGWEEFKKITAKPEGAPIDFADFKALLDHELGIFKGSPPAAARAALLNQLDTLPPQTRPGLHKHFPANPTYAVIAGSFISQEFYLLS
jgi:probable selenium-dependent hydroxylase accessory protein YqeC